MTGDIHLLEADPIPLAVVRQRVQRSELATVVPQGCGTVWSFAKARGLAAGRHVAVYLSGAIDLEVGVEVAGPFDGDGNVHPSATPAGPVVSATHIGPYQGLGATHEAIRAWCRTHGHRPTGPNWEIYGHWQPEWNADPSAIRTDVFYQVEPASPQG